MRTRASHTMPSPRNSPLFLSADAVAQALPYPALMATLAAGLQTPISTPPRSHYEPNGDASTLLVMPAWRAGQQMGVKLVTVWPDNALQGLPAVAGVYVLMSCQDGRALAVMDGTELTLRRTAACAALGARLLARRDSQRLLVLGTGALCLPLVQAHAAALPIRQVQIWGRRLAAAEAAAEQARALGLDAQAQPDLHAALAEADVVVAATTATTPFIPSDQIRPGTHLGLVGAFTPQMAEAEPALLARAQVFVDHRASALQKGGELFQALQSGLLTADAVQAELAELVAEPQRAWRRSDAAITVFKSVGFAALDLLAAEQVMAQQPAPMGT